MYHGKVICADDSRLEKKDLNHNYRGHQQFRETIHKCVNRHMRVLTDPKLPWGTAGVTHMNCPGASIRALKRQMACKTPPEFKYVARIHR